ncbi:hypothetical protein Ga0466249_002246 [Sporomusaceae bacterium BoRhaA]|nr:hypothetical protein [Pelorhabdus rhamnosifermentans]
MNESGKLPDYQFKKSTCERYDIRFNRGEWAIFTIDENGGLFNCHSSYGDYAYSWPNHGRKTFKHFLIELERDYWYLLNKVSDKTYFNFDKTVAKWKKEIIEWRKECEITKQQARDAFDVINDLDEGMSADYTYTKFIESDGISDLCPDAWEVFDCVKEYPGEAMTFAKTIMPMFADILKKEIVAGEQS